MTMPPMIFLHGWGTHPVIWEPMQQWLPESRAWPLPGYAGTLPAATFGQLADRLAAQIETPVVLVGWSLGGQVAMRIAGQHPEKIVRLVLIGTTPCFVSREDWLNAVADEVFEQFAENLQQDYAGTIRRFLALQAQGSDSVRAVLAELRNRLLSQPRPAAGVLEAGLSMLRQNDLRNEVAQLQMPVTLIHGTGDKLAPTGAAQWLAETIPQSRLHEIRGAAHAPFLSHAREVAEVIAGG